MARTKRIDLPFTLYHVFSRTNSDDLAFRDARDSAKFLEYVAKYVSIFDFRVHAWCLMPNHFHLLLESEKQPAISEFMRRLLTAYTVFYNRRHARHGHLFQGRFKSIVVDKSNYLLALSRYIHLNPILSSGGGALADPEAYQGSSLQFYLKGGEPDFLHTKEILAWFNGDRKQYGRFVRDGLNEDIKPQIIQRRFVGGEDFVRRLNARLQLIDQKGSRSHAASQKENLARMKDETARAGDILRAVAGYFHLSPGYIRRSRFGRDDLIRARAVCAALLRDHLPWTCRKIEEFLSVKGMYYLYLNRIKDDRKTQEALEKLGAAMNKML
jgi:REP element-mobilizing transposase RayT